jgi:hypothetical protein
MSRYTWMFARANLWGQTMCALVGSPEEYAAQVRAKMYFWRWIKAICWANKRLDWRCGAIHIQFGRRAHLYWEPETFRRRCFTRPGNDLSRCSLASLALGRLLPKRHPQIGIFCGPVNGCGPLLVMPCFTAISANGPVKPGKS